MKKIVAKRLILGLIIVLVALVVGYWLHLSENKETNLTLNPDQFYVYYINETGSQLYPVAVTVDKEKEPEQQAKQLLASLKQDDSDNQYFTALTPDTTISKTKLKDKNFMINLSLDYSDAMIDRQVLCRAALAKTLTQIDGINTVEITVAGEALTINDAVVGPFDGTAYVDYSSSVLSDQMQMVTLYFANGSGDGLVKCEQAVKLDGSTPIETMIVNKIIEGPSDEELKAVIPKGTKVISTSTKEGVCYVDLSQEFLNTLEGVSDSVTLYAIVNSLSELSTVSKVQFTIAGQTVLSYHEGLALDQLFERNLDIIKTE